MTAAVVAGSVAAAAVVSAAADAVVAGRASTAVAARSTPHAETPSANAASDTAHVCVLRVRRQSVVANLFDFKAPPPIFGRATTVQTGWNSVTNTNWPPHRGQPFLERNMATDSEGAP